MAERPDIRSVDILVDRVANDAALADRVKADPVPTLNLVADTVKRENPITPQDDKFTFRIAVMVLSVVILAVVCLIGYAAVVEVTTKVPESLVALGSTALGALAGLLAPSSAKSG